MFKSEIHLFSRLSGLLFLLLITFSAAAQQDTISRSNEEKNKGKGKTVDLDEVQVTAKRPPFVMRKDTMEFDAAAIKLMPQSMVEDLLKRLPGVRIDASGNITVNGKKVSKIQVDGRDFFGGNSSAATKNLPASIVDKVKVSKYKNRDREFSQLVRAPEDEVVINLTLKEDQKRGILGDVQAGYGTRKRYAGAGMINAFQGKERISAYVGAGNGSSDFAVDGISMSGGGSGGISESRNAMANFNTEYSEQLTLDANYGYDHQKNSNEQLTDRLNFLDNGALSYTENQNSVSRNSGQRLSVTISYKPDTLSNWRFMPSFNYNPNHNQENRFGASRDAAGALINTADSRTSTDGNRWGMQNFVMYNRKSRDGKTSFRLNWSFNLQRGSGTQLNQSENRFFSPSVPDSSNVIDQINHTNDRGIGNNLSMELSRNLGAGFLVGLQYNIGQQSNSSRKQAFRNGGQHIGYVIPDSLFSNDSRNSNLIQQPTLQFAYRKGQLELALNGAMNIIRQRNSLLLQDSVIRIDQAQFSPNMQLNYNMKDRGSINFGYSISPSAPTQEQLAPVADPANPLLVVIGNPGLKTSLTHSMQASYNKMVPKSGLTAYLNGSLSFTKNQIVTDATYDTLGRQVQSFRNVDGARNVQMDGGLQSSHRIGALTILPSVGINVTNSRDVGFINSKRNESRQEQYGVNLSLLISYKEYFSLSPGGGLSFNKTGYSLNELDDLSYNSGNFRMTFQVNPISRLELGGSYFYRYNSQIPVEFQRSSQLLNASLSYRFLKKQQLNAKIAVNDLLNNNVSSNTTITSAYRENVQSNALKRYVMFVLQYNFNALGRQG